MFSAPTSSGYLGGFRTNDLHWSTTDECVMRRQITYFDLVRRRAEQQKTNMQRMKIIRFLLRWVVLITPHDEVPTKKWKIFLWTRTTVYVYIATKILLTILYSDQLIPIYGDPGISFGHLKLIMNLTCFGVSTFAYMNHYLFRRNFDWTFYDTLADDGSDHNLSFSEEAILTTKLKKPNFSLDLLTEDTKLNGMINNNLSHDKGNLYLVSPQFYLSKYLNGASVHDNSANIWRPASPTVRCKDEDEQPHVKKNLFTFRGNRVSHENEGLKTPIATEVNLNSDARVEQDTVNSWRYIVRLQFRQMLKVCKFDNLHSNSAFASKLILFGVVSEIVLISSAYFGAYFFFDRDKINQYPQLSESLQILYMVEFWYLYLEMVIASLVYLCLYLLSSAHSIELSEKLFVQLKLCADDCYEMFGNLHLDQLDATNYDSNNRKDTTENDESFNVPPSGHNELYKFHQRIVWLLNSIQMYSFYLSDRTKIWVVFLSGGVIIVNFLFIAITWQMTFIVTELKESTGSLLRVVVGAMPPLFYYIFLTVVCAKTGDLYHKVSVEG